MTEAAADRVFKAKAECDRLKGEIEIASAAAAAAVKQVDLTTRLEAKADARVAEAKSAEEVLATSIGDAVTENARTRSKLEQAASEVEAARKKLDRLGASGSSSSSNGGGGSGTRSFDFEQEVSMGEVFELDSPTKMAASAVEKLSDRDLNEVRKLPKPPELVRRALELVSALLATSEGASSLPAPGEVPWAELQKLIARDDFIRRVLAMHPRALSQAPKLLDELKERYPFLEHAAGTKRPASLASRRPSTAASRWGSAVQKVQKATKENDKAAAGAGQSKPAAAAPSKPPGKPPASASGRRLLSVVTVAVAEAEVVTAAAAAAPAPNGSLTVENVEYASRACGALFRYCANCWKGAMLLAAERAAAQAELDRALQVLNGVTGEHTATQVYLENLMEQQARQEAQRQAHEVAVAKAVDARLEAKVQGRKAEEKLEALRAALEDAEAKLAAAEAALQRRREAEEKRGKKLDKEAQAAEDLRNAQMQIELDLATRPPARPPCWLYEPPLSEAARRVFVEFAQPHSAALPINAAVSLAKLAKELNSSVELRVHLAGHVGSDEDARWGSQRAMAVGGALIALGVLPLQLRAKGYGSKVPISRMEKLRLGIKSLRRVTVHSLGEIKCRDGCGFGPGESELSDAVRELLGHVAALMLSEKHKALRICVEGHTDNRGDSESNAKLSMSRAQAVAKHLSELGVDMGRLSPHGFGSTFPVDSNETDDGRRANRRVELLVIPACFAAAEKMMGTKEAATSLSNHTSNRPGVARFVS